MTRRGYTLLELTLVMAIIVIMAALAFPMMDSMFGPSKVGAAADAIRGRLADARAQAMNDGRPYKFSIQTNTGLMRIEPDDMEEVQVEGEGYIAEDHLPDRCIFVTDFAVLMDANAPAGGGDWETTVIYNPDGTAQEDVDIMFGVVGLGTGQTLHVRALTGRATKVAASAEK